MKRICVALSAILSMIGAAPSSTSAVSVVDNKAFVAQLYRDLLERPPDVNGLALFVGLLDHGASRGDVASMILTSTEYRSNLIQSLYSALLNRPATPGEVSVLIGLLLAGASDEDVIAVIVSSAEYFHLHGDSNALFLNALYEDLLGRPIDPDALAFWQRLLEGGGSRRDVALAILGSAEYRTMLVQRYSLAYLLRRPTSDETARFLKMLDAGATDEEIIANIVGSEEYFLAVAPTMRDLCKERAWRRFAHPLFRNQGQCVSALGRVE